MYELKTCLDLGDLVAGLNPSLQLRCCTDALERKVSSASWGDAFRAVVLRMKGAQVGVILMRR